MIFRRQFVAPMSGIIKPLSEIDDEVFASGSMGDGFMIEYDGKEVISPISGTVIAVFPTGHAFGLQDKKGREYIVHIGLDSFDIKEGVFKVHVEQGEKVKAGDLLVTVDAQDLQEAGISTSSAVVCTSGEKLELLKTNIHVNVGDKGIIRIKK